MGVLGELLVLNCPRTTTQALSNAFFYYFLGVLQHISHRKSKGAITNTL